MPDKKANVFTIPASARFLEVLIDALLDGRLIKGFPANSDPLELARATLYLPTRRAARLARDVFLARAKGDGAILPRIVALGDIEEDEFVFADAAGAELAADALQSPPALSGLERTMPLARLILKWAQTIAPDKRGETPLVAGNPATAFALAQDLARLMDNMTTRGVEWEELDELVPDEYDDYWGLTLDFVKFIREQWPAIRDEQGPRLEPAERRDRLIAAERKRLNKTTDPVIAAGSTGSIPATATLLETIAELPNGAVVLPGLDLDLDEDSWTFIVAESEAAHGHPQFAMAALLKRIGIARSTVQRLGQPIAHGRERLVSEALRPAEASERWRALHGDAGFAAAADAAMKDVAVIETANAEEEALAIAVALREAVETNKTAALVTPDVGLGRRVAALLDRWALPVEDSCGEPLAETPHGVLARLALEAAISGAAPVPLLALLKHPQSKFDGSAVAALERAILRGPRPKHGTFGLAAALASVRAEIARHRAGQESVLHRPDPRLLLTDAELDAAAALIGDLKEKLAPLETASHAMQSVKDWAIWHEKVVGAFARVRTELGDIFAQLQMAENFEITAFDYAELFHAAIAECKIYAPPKQARVYIFGLLEARLQSVDRLALGGMVEGVWPPETRGDPWLSRPMRRDLGLDLPERRIGLSAHDFAQALGANEVILSRAAKLSGAPTVASRFVQRLAAVAGEARWEKALERGARYAAWARSLDEPADPAPAPRPAPTPPFVARPKRLSVTEIEDLLRDPYTIYAKHVLKLVPLDAVDTPPGAADRGSVIHESIAEFDRAYPNQLPADAAHTLTEIGEKHFKPFADFPEARAFWWPRFLRIAEWFARYDAERRAGLKRLEVEKNGSIAIPFGNETFTLSVRADRIECRADGRYAILDFKTGDPPSDRQVRSGLSPQLSLEAAILRKGGFKDIPASSVAEIVYVRLRGGAEAGKERVVDLDGLTVDQHADEALAELTGVLAKFADEKNPYLSLLHPMWKDHYGTYDHLARVKEWSLTGGAAEDETPE